MARSGLWRTKSIEQSIADTDLPGSRLRRELSAWDLTVFGVAVCVGAGIFTLAASTAGDVSGPAVSLSFVLAAIACALAGLCYIEFASTVPVAGSAYTYSYATFGVLVAVVAATVEFGTLAELVNVGTLFAFVLVSIGIIVLRRTRPELPRAFRVPLVPWLPIAAVLACLWLMLNLTAFTWLRFLGWMVLGLAVYVAYGARKSRLRARHPSAADEQVR